MPLIVQPDSLSEERNYFFWHATESSDELSRLANLTVEQKGFLEGLPLEKRKREYLSTRLLLHHASPEKELKFLTNGKPVFTDGWHLSISHCENLAGLIISRRNVGLDIQSPDEKLRKIRMKYCQRDELNFRMDPDLELQYLTVLWSAKEAVFKFFGEGVHFAKDLFVQPFSLTDSKIHLAYQGIHGNQNFVLHHLQWKEFHVVFTGSSM